MSKESRKKRAQTRRRKQRRTRLIWGVTLAGLLVIGGLQALSNRRESTASLAPEVGALAPDFTLANLGGQLVSLSDFRGRPVAAMFFHTW